MIETTSLVSVEVMQEALVKHSKLSPPGRYKKGSFGEPELPSFSKSNKELSPPWASTETKGMDFYSHLVIIGNPSPIFLPERCQRKPDKTGLNEIQSLIT